MFPALLLILCVLPGFSAAPAQPPGVVVAWGDNSQGQSSLPEAAQSDVIAIAAGGSHTVALKNDGSLVALGNNEYGQTTVPEAAQSGVTAIATAAGHTVALKNDGTVVAWGNNSDGQTTVPAGLSGVTAIAAGRFHTVALKGDGSVVAWGAGKFSGGGHPNFGQSLVPEAAQSGVTAIASGFEHSVALKNDGSVVAWGWNENGQTTVPASASSGVIAIAAGYFHTVALKSDGSVVAWGENGFGQTTVPEAAQSGVTTIASGAYHIVALKNDGTVVAWGYNINGQVSGTPTGDDVEPRFSAVASPVSLRGQVLSGVVAIAGGELHTVALFIPTAPTITRQPVGQTASLGQKVSFNVSALGYPSPTYQWRKDGLDLDGATSPLYNLSALTNQAGNYTVVISNSAGSVTSAPPALLTVNTTALGTALAWGSDFTDVGHSRYYTGQDTAPGVVQEGVTAIATGYFHTLALKSDGTVAAWGLDHEGQVTGSPGVWAAIASPVTLEGQVLRGVTAIAAGCFHSLTLKSDGSVVAWGSNDNGQITVPASAGSGVVAIAAGFRHSVALKSDGTVVAWGYNGAGQTTVPEAAQSGVIAIAAGDLHTAALKNDGTVVAWGNDDAGQTTVPEAAQSGVIAIAAGAEHTVALKNDGTLVAWGYNGEGQVSGIPATEEPYSVTSPVTLRGQVLSGVAAIAAGGFHTLALKTDGTVVAWGGNFEGQLLVPDGLSGVTAIAAGRFHSVVLFGSTVVLRAEPSGNELLLSWPVNAVGFTLQSTTNLADGNSWTRALTVPVVEGSQNQVTESISGPATFYRLKK